MVIDLGEKKMKNRIFWLCDTPDLNAKTTVLLDA
jgi:hypothetical protein